MVPLAHFGGGINKHTCTVHRDVEIASPDRAFLPQTEDIRRGLIVNDKLNTNGLHVLDHKLLRVLAQFVSLRGLMLQAEALAILKTNPQRANLPPHLFQQLPDLRPLIRPGLDAAVEWLNVKVRGAEGTPSTKQPVNDPLFVDAVSDGLTNPDVSQDGMWRLVVGGFHGANTRVVF